MENLKNTYLELKKTMEEYRKFKEEKSIIRKKCDEKIKEEMKEFCDEMRDIAECADILLDNFSHYGSSIRFPINITDDEDGIIFMCFNQEDYCITRGKDNQLLFRSGTDIDKFPISSYEYLIINSQLILSRTIEKISTFLKNETDNMNKNMSNETAYYDLLCDRLFSEDEAE